MTLTELRYIVALAQDGNFSRAAERCSVSQPTLSVAIARLEDELGSTFRARQGLRQPERGRRPGGRAGAAGLARGGEGAADRAAKDVTRLDGPLRLGVIHTIGPYLLPQPIHALKRVAPRMPLAIEENMTASLADLLRDNEVDVVIVALPSMCPAS